MALCFLERDFGFALTLRIAKDSFAPSLPEPRGFCITVVWLSENKCTKRRAKVFPISNKTMTLSLLKNNSLPLGLRTFTLKYCNKRSKTWMLHFRTFSKISRKERNLDSLVLNAKESEIVFDTRKESISRTPKSICRKLGMSSSVNLEKLKEL